jgi:hypothetical protein
MMCCGDLVVERMALLDVAVAEVAMSHRCMPAHRL